MTTALMVLMLLVLIGVSVAFVALVGFGLMLAEVWWRRLRDRRRGLHEWPRGYVDSVAFRRWRTSNEAVATWKNEPPLPTPDPIQFFTLDPLRPNPPIAQEPWQGGGGAFAGGGASGTWDPSPAPAADSTSCAPSSNDGGGSCDSGSSGGDSSDSSTTRD